MDSDDLIERTEAAFFEKHRDELGRAHTRELQGALAKKLNTALDDAGVTDEQLDATAFDSMEAVELAYRGAVGISSQKI